MESLGKRLYYARKKMGYTQESLADAIGVSRGVIYNLEKSKSSPQEIVINAICHTMRIRKEWLLDGTGEMEDTTESPKSTRILTELYEVAMGLSEREQLYLLDSVKSLRALLYPV